MQSYKMNNMETMHPNYSYVFGFEENFEHEATREWMLKYWTSGFLYCGLYVLFIFGMQHYMRNRPRFDLRRVLVLWNIMLASFSFMGVCRTAPEFFHVFNNFGFYYSVCVPRFLRFPNMTLAFVKRMHSGGYLEPCPLAGCSDLCQPMACALSIRAHSRGFIEDDCVSGFWTWMFVLSKLPELGDTVFIVLRKQPLIFLHWYHHVTVLLYSWFSYTEYTSSARWFIVMNYFVHTIMYSYYALRAMGFMLPRLFAMLITACQLMQMVVGCTVNIWAYSYVSAGQDCHISYTNIKLSIAMYFSYFVLFVWFFYNAYFVIKKPKHDSSKTKLA